jgi:hypothetical protein
MKFKLLLIVKDMNKYQKNFTYHMQPLRWDLASNVRPKLRQIFDHTSCLLKEREITYINIFM